MRLRWKTARKVLVFAVAFVGGLYVADRWMTPRTLADESPSAVGRAELPADVQAVLSRVEAWATHSPAAFEGDMVVDFDVAGMKESKTTPFKSIYQAADTFRHESDDVLLVAGNGSAHIYDPRAKQYLSTTQPAHASASQPADAKPGLAEEVLGVLKQQNPALYLAVKADAATALVPAGSRVRLLEQQTTDGTTFDRLESSGDMGTCVAWVEQTSGALRRVDFDFSELLRREGAADIKRAQMSVVYKPAAAPSPIDSALFVFTPPPNATEIKPPAPGEMLAGAEPSALEGKPAPSFSLKTHSGEDVAVDGKGGSVVVLDFWATWCPPCREGLPHLAEVARTFADRGVKVYAINVQEDAEKVKQFLADQKLSLIAPLDTDGAVSRSYLVSGIPQTVVIGVDGKVRKVFVGFSETSAKQLDEAIEAALK